jgi:hypothetical protein
MANGTDLLQSTILPEKEAFGSAKILVEKNKKPISKITLIFRDVF